MAVGAVALEMVHREVGVDETVGSGLGVHVMVALFAGLVRARQVAAGQEGEAWFDLLERAYRFGLEELRDALPEEGHFRGTKAPRRDRGGAESKACPLRGVARVEGDGIVVRGDPRSCQGAFSLPSEQPD